MIIKHVTNQGRELGSYQSISTASKHLGKDVFLLSVAIRNRVPLDDGSYILRVRPKQADAKLKKNAIVQMLREYIKLDTHPR